MDGLESDVHMALFQVRDAERKIALYGDWLIPKARESLHVTQQGFEAALLDFQSLIDAERLLLEFELLLERARTTRSQRLAELDRLAGERLK